MPQHPAAAPQPPRALADAVVPLRQCGRCRGMFEGDPTVAPGPFPDWWLCDDCQRKLLPGRPARVAPSARAVRPE
jgi:hypothetical protein